MSQQRNATSNLIQQRWLDLPAHTLAEPVVCDLAIASTQLLFKLRTIGASPIPSLQNLCKGAIRA
eukprot:2266972-Amphidinium_carterae.1